MRQTTAIIHLRGKSIGYEVVVGGGWYFSFVEEFSGIYIGKLAY